MNRRTAGKLIMHGGLTALALAAIGCSDTQLPTSPNPPSSPRTEPLQSVTTQKNATALLKFYGYAGTNQSLLEIFRNYGYSPVVNSAGLITALLNEKPVWGWIFYVENKFFGTDAANMRLRPGELWAAYVNYAEG